MRKQIYFLANKKLHHGLKISSGGTLLGWLEAVCWYTWACFILFFLLAALDLSFRAPEMNFLWWAQNQGKWWYGIWSPVPISEASSWFLYIIPPLLATLMPLLSKFVPPSSHSLSHLVKLVLAAQREEEALEHYHKLVSQPCYQDSLLNHSSFLFTPQTWLLL